MTKIEEAIAYIDSILNATVFYDESLDYVLTTDDNEWLREAKNALEKQIPKKTKVIRSNFADLAEFHCPSCDKRLISRLDGEWLAGRLTNYCADCGQKLDWSEDE